MEVLKKSNRLLMTFQWENMLSFMQIGFNAANLPTVKIGNFRAVLKETILAAFSTNADGVTYSFEVVLNFPTRQANFFLSNLKKIPFVSLQELDLFIRVKYPKDNRFYNDRTSLKKLCAFYPDLKQKIDLQILQYSDLIHLGERMFRSFKINYLNPEKLKQVPTVNALSYFIKEGLAEIEQTRNSTIGNFSEKYKESKYPILLCRKTMTVQPMRVAVIMLPSADTVEFYVYALDSNIECSKIVSLADVELNFPFLRTLLPQPGFRQSIGERLFTTYKNTLLMELYFKEDQIKSTTKVGFRNPNLNLKRLNLTMLRGEKLKL
jgi:hypothetical protein